MPERAGRDERLDLPGSELLLEGEPLGGVGLAGVRRDVVTARAQEVGDLLGGRDREAVDDPRTGLLGEMVGQPAEALLGRGQTHDAEPERLAVERSAQHQHLGTQALAGHAARAQLLGDVGTHPGVGGRRGGEHRDAGGQVGQEGADTAVVGPEVVAPVGDAVGLVDHQQPAGRREPWQHLVAEAGVVEPLGAHQQDVDLAGGDGVLDRLPLLDVGGVDGDRADPGPLGGSDLVAHQGQQGRHDHGRARALGPEEQGRHEVDRGLAPAGALDHQRAPALDDQRFDRRPLVVAQGRVVAPDQRPEVALGLGADVGPGGGHPHCLAATPTAYRPPQGCRVASRRDPPVQPPFPDTVAGSPPVSPVGPTRRPARPSPRRTTTGRGRGVARAGSGRPHRPAAQARSRGSP